MSVTTFSTEDFVNHLTVARGRVDFVFEDDRPFPECHASTLVETEPGSLLCAWFGGTYERHADVGIWLSRFRDGAWSAPKRIAKVDDTPHWNPVLFRDPKRGVSLFFKVGWHIPRWRTLWMSSGDGGATWSTPVELVPDDEGGRGPVKNKPILLSDGAWLAPASTEHGAWRCFADRSADGGKTWARTADFEVVPDVVPGKGVIQPTFWENPDGSVHALMRSTSGYIMRSDSLDAGWTWTPVRATSLPNNNSGIDAVRLSDGRLLLVYNPVGNNWGSRTPLTLAVSEDEGASWADWVNLETASGEYSYPAIVPTSQGVAISYTWKRERIRLWQIPLEALSRR